MRKYLAEFSIYDEYNLELEKDSETFTDFDEAYKYIQRYIRVWFEKREVELYGDFVIKETDTENDSLYTEWRYDYNGQLLS